MFGYLCALRHISKSEDSISVNFNVGPQDSNSLTVLDICEQAKKWFPTLSLKTNSELVAESKFLLLDSKLLTQSTGWKPVYDTYKAVEQTFKWYYSFDNGDNINDLVNKDIQDYLTKNN